jgi:hypothetical protein
MGGDVPAMTRWLHVAEDGTETAYAQPPMDKPTLRVEVIDGRKGTRR